MSNEPPPPNESSETQPSTDTTSEATVATSSYDPKVIGIVAYITLIGWIVALIMNNPKSDFGSFHLRQALGIWLLGLVSAFVFIVPILGWIAGMVGYLAAFVFWILGLISAIQGEKKLVPLIGEKAQEWFKAL
ncbi:MAG: hypothetical protein AAGJ81_07365 [Verrucomicrobiota bacterium]